LKKLKILIITQYFWPENFKINDLAFHLAKSGYDIHVLTGIPNYPHGSYFKGYNIFSNINQIEKNVQIYRTFIVPRGKDNKFQLILNYISFILFASMKVVLLKNRYDLIFIYEPSPITVAVPAIVLKKISQIPIILWVTDLWPESVTATVKMNRFNKKLLESILNPLVSWIYNKSDKILVTSKGFANSIQKKLQSKNKIIFFPQWAESFFRPVKKTNFLLPHINKNSFTVMFAGNIGEAQDFPAILEAAKKLIKYKDIHWIIIGSGRKENWVKNKIDEYGLNHCFHLLGSYPIEKMPMFYAHADAMLFSLKDEYIFSITIPAKVQSYLACGKPILAMVNGEASKIIEESNAGFTCKSGDSYGLSNIVLDMYNLSSDQLKLLGANSLECYIRCFDRRALFKKAEGIIFKTINKYKI